MIDKATANQSIMLFCRFAEFVGGDGRTPCGIQMAIMTVLRCHFAASGDDDPLVNLVPLGHNRSQCSVAYRDHANNRFSHRRRCRTQNRRAAAFWREAWDDGY